jgi:hypothetical protein
MRTYILERTQDFFVRQPDEPCSRLRAWGPPTRGQLRFDPLHQQRRCALLTARGLIL